MKILAIDDNNDNLITLKAIIKDHFHDVEVISATSGKKGLFLLKEFSPDVIILDVIMPEMDGYEVCEVIRSNEETQNIPVIFLTALKENKENRLKALEVGGDVFLSKPFDEAELIAQIRAMTKLKQFNDLQKQEKATLESLVQEKTEELQRTHFATLNLLEDLREENETRKRKENALIESETRFKMLFEQAPVGYQSMDEDGKLVYVNQTWLDLLGYPREDVIGKPFSRFLAPAHVESQKKCFQKFKDRGSIHVEFDMIKNDHSIITVSIEGRIGYDENGSFKQTHCVLQDITEKRKAEQARIESEIRYRNLFEESPVSIWEEDFSLVKKRLDELKAEGVTDFHEFFINNRSELLQIAKVIDVIDVNQETMRLFGANSKEDLKNSFTNIYTEKSLDQLIEELENIANGKTNFPIDFTNRTLDGRVLEFSAKWAAMPGYENDLSKVLISMVDITDRKKNEVALRENEQRYRSLFEDSPVAIFEEDFSKAYEKIQMFKEAGVSDFRSFFRENPDKLLECVKSVLIVNVNTAAVTLFKARNKDDLLVSLNKVVPENTSEYLFEEFVYFAEGKTHFHFDTVNYDLKNNPIYLSVYWAVVQGYSKSYSKVNVSVIDITDRRLAELAIKDSEQRYRSLFDDSPIAIFEEDYSAVKARLDELKKEGVTNFKEYLTSHPGQLSDLINRIVVNHANQQALKLFGAQTQFEFFGHNERSGRNFDPMSMVEEFDNIAKGLTKFEKEINAILGNGNEHYLNYIWTTVPGYEKSLAKVIVTVVDLTERKELENRQQKRLLEMEAIDKITTALREASTKEEALPIFLQETLKMMQVEMGFILLHHPSSDVLRISDAIGVPDAMLKVEIRPGEGEIGKVFLTGEPVNASNLLQDTPDRKEIRDIHMGFGGVCVPIQTQEDILGVLVVVFPEEREVKTDDIRLLEAFARIAGITLHRMTLHENTLVHLQQLQVQRTIDQTIASIFDLNLTLEIICSEARNYLKANAAGLLLFNPVEHTLTFAAEKGFRTHIYKNTRIPLGSGPAGKVAMSRDMIHIKDLFNSDPPFKTVRLLQEENFLSYLGIPLVAKGELKGVMEIFFTTETDFEPDLLEFIHSLAFQTAIAIDNLQLFENLQRSNQELVQAYDATIEGWSRAMDLRDKETEEHTKRVTEMATKIARIMDITEEEIVHVRRGALLHDIGKMGVPDEILRKPGPLTPEEWVIMKQHPVFAYEMIAPIDYLKPALDIPYCHHEKWDGTGYPRGLKEEKIPLAGRIFAVIDVWDALSSDRPYRKAWDKERVRNYIEEQSGSHFDPEVVKIFLEVIESEDWQD